METNGQLKMLDVLPESLTHLKLLNSNFNTLPTLLPSFLTHLSLSKSFVQSIDGLLPDSLQNLSIHRSHILSSLPPSLKKLKISHMTTPLPPLPATLQILNIILAKKYVPSYPFDSISQHTSITTLSVRGKWKDNSINFLPPNLILLILFPWQECLPISKPWPSSLKSLAMSYNHPLSNLPSSLTRLSLRDFFHPLDNLPPSLKSLGLLNQLQNTVYEHPLKNLPLSLQTLRIGSPLSHIPSLPPSLTFLEIDPRNIDVDFTHLTKLTTLITPTTSNIPSSLTSLTLYDEDCLIPPLPSKLTHLGLSDYIHLPLPSHLPSSLEYLKCGFSQLPHELPSTLRHLGFWIDNYNTMPLLPENLTELYILSNKVSFIFKYLILFGTYSIH